MIIGVAFNKQQTTSTSTITKYYYPNNNQPYIPNIPGYGNSLGTLSNYGHPLWNIGTFNIPSDYASGDVLLYYTFHANIQQYNATSCEFWISIGNWIGQTQPDNDNMMDISNIINNLLVTTGVSPPLFRNSYTGVITSVSANQSINILIHVNYPYRTVTGISVSIYIKYTAYSS